MAQVYPSPTIFTYRVVGYGKNNMSGNTPVWFKIEYSANAGTTWGPAANQPFNSLIDAYQEIAQIVGQEATFAAAQSSVNPLVPGNVIYSYPV